MNSENYSPQSNEASLERIDELEKYYKPIENIDASNNWVFWLSAILSIAVFFKNQIPWSTLQDLPETLFITAVIIHLTLSLYTRFYLFPFAERKRRRQLLSDSFAVPLITEITQKYYNNEISPSIARLGANLLENTLFAKNISLKMVQSERIKIFVYFLIWILAVYWRSTNLGLLVIITQTIFSSQLIENWIRLELLAKETDKLYDDLYNKFLHKTDLSSSDGIASVLDAFATYESVKSMTGIRQLRSIFLNVNPDLSKEWDMIRTKLGIAKSVDAKKPRKH
jgi:hypothetical protein